MPRAAKAMIVAALASLSMIGQALSQVRDRYDNSLDLRAPLSRQPRTVVTNTPRRELPDNCYTGITTDKNISCVAPNRVAAPPPGVPCTPKTALRNPDLGALPNTCR
jgi:hypothetical protein